ncbi:hypothetical protein PR003_g34679 [Phytophthora rubi]|uniref:Uncharacterized protein n=1 Tax=Phytophthora rubi TaxID=129364 RepID=A0A6A3GIN7_9STRA|nr:hypothetical protein PR002_g31270 [Phytophthora rubi]KAE9259698.1 hypothetical protein PR003_g34679 [Phytophthora rubi]
MPSEHPWTKLGLSMLCLLGTKGCNPPSPVGNNVGKQFCISILVVYSFMRSSLRFSSPVG